MNVKPWLLLLLLAFLTGACSVPKDITYFQGIDAFPPERIAEMNQTYVSRISEDDLLTITVTAWDPTVVTPFNPPTYAYATQGETGIYAAQQLHTYLVGADGAITFPVIGRVIAAGLSKQELEDHLQQQIAKYVSDALVTVQIVNYKVTVMGEVARPGALTIRNDRTSILDALGQVGDLTINADRKNILIVREIDGKKEFARLDVTDPAIFTSPYYYLRQNDIVYVEPNDAKKRNSRYSQAQQYNLTIFSSILSAVSVITTVLVAISNSK